MRWTIYDIPAVYHDRCISSLLLDAHNLINDLQHSVHTADLPIWPPAGNMELDHLVVVFGLPRGYAKIEHFIITYINTNA